MNATVKDVMTTEVVTVRRDTSFKEMAATLRRYRVSALPVVDDAERVIGVVSEGDLLAKEALADPGVMAEVLHHKDVRKAEGVTAGELMTQPAVTAAPDDPLEQVARMMHFMRVKRLPVVNSGGQPRRDRQPVRPARRVRPAGRGHPQGHRRHHAPARVPHRPAPRSR